MHHFLKSSYDFFILLLKISEILGIIAGSLAAFSALSVLSGIADDGLCPRPVERCLHAKATACVFGPTFTNNHCSLNCSSSLYNDLCMFGQSVGSWTT